MNRNKKNSNREYLTKNSILNLKSHNNLTDEFFQFKIGKVLEEDEETILYEATLNGETGYLREFYPRSNERYIYRDPKTNYLKLSHKDNFDDRENQFSFLENSKEYLSRFLNFGLKRDEIYEAGPGISSDEFIIRDDPPTFRLYKSDDNNQTPYIWTRSSEKNIGLVDYVSYIRENTEIKQENKLFAIISLLKSLTKYAQAFEEVVNYSLDFSTVNFMIRVDNRIKNIREDKAVHAIKLTNLNLFRFDKNSNKNFSTTLLDLLDQGLNINRNYMVNGNIKQLLQESDILIKASLNSNIDYSSIIEKIYKKLDELNIDYDQLYGLYDELTHKFFQSFKSENQDIKIFLNNQDDYSFRQNALLKTYLKYPVYNYVDLNKDSDINICILGSGVFGSKFLDVSLQINQVLNHKLNFTVYSHDANTKGYDYLSDRIYLLNLVTLHTPDYQPSNPNDPLASINFKELPHKEDNEDIKETFENVLSQIDTQNDYYFLSLGNEDLNFEVAKLLAQIIDDRIKKETPILFISSSNNIEEEIERLNQSFTYSRLIQINFIEDSSLDDYVLKQLSFNLYMVWKDFSSQSYDKLYREFSEWFDKDNPDKENMAIFILALLNNLQALGLKTAKIIPDYSQKSLSLLSKAAEDYKKMFLDNEDERTEIEFPFMQHLHNIWQLNRAVNGWRSFFLISLPVKPIKYGVGRYHVALEPMETISSFRGMDLTQSFSQLSLNFDANEIDRLDKASLRYSQYYYQKKTESNGAIKDIEENLNYISRQITVYERKYIENFGLKDQDRINLRNTYSQITDAFEELEFCYKNILNNNQTYAGRFEEILDDFIQTINSVYPELYENIRISLDGLTEKIRDLIRGTSFHDFKLKYQRVFDSIPFILTNNTEFLLVSFLNIGEQEKNLDHLFSSVASSLVLQPEELVLIGLYTEQNQFRKYVDRLESICNFIQKRKLKTKVRLILGIETVTHKYKALSKALGKLSFESVDLFEYKDESEAAESVKAFIDNLIIRALPVTIDLSSQLFSNQKNQYELIRFFENKDLATFEFDSRERNFHNLKHCEHFKYIDTSKFYLRVYDLFTLSHRTDRIRHLPEFLKDYKEIWSVYTGDYLRNNTFKYPEQKLKAAVNAWHSLALKLEPKNPRNDTNTFNFRIIQKGDHYITANESDKKVTIQFHFPDFCFDAVNHLIDILKRYGVIQAESYVINELPGTCSAVLEFNEPDSENILSLFSEPLRFSNKKLFQEYLTPGTGAIDYLNIVFLDLFSGNFFIATDTIKENDRITWNEIRDLDQKALLNLSPDLYLHKRGDKNLYYLLRRLEEKGYILDLKFPKTLRNGQVKTFCEFYYSSLRIKEILESAGKVLEIYSFYQLLESNYFDDIISSYEVLHNDVNYSESEIDLILTKGFKSYIVECKARNTLTPVLYHSVSNLGRLYGINYEKILLHFNYSNNSGLIHESVQDFGEQLNVLTVTELSSVNTLGDIFKRLDKHSSFHSEND